MAIDTAHIKEIMPAKEEIDNFKPKRWITSNDQDCPLCAKCGGKEIKSTITGFSFHIDLHNSPLHCNEQGSKAGLNDIR